MGSMLEGGASPAAGTVVPLAVPEDWLMVRLRDRVSFERGVSWSKSDEDPGGVPVIAIPNVRDGRVDFKIRYRIRRRLGGNKLLLRGDLLLVGSSGSPRNIGRTASVTSVPFPECTYASFLVKAVPKKDKANRDFLRFLFASGVISFRLHSKRAADGKYNLQLRQLANAELAIPSLDEQHRIARVLSTIQRAIEAQDKVIAAARELKRSLMKHLFTYGAVPVTEASRVPLKETEIGPVPAHWEVERLGDFCEFLQYGTSKRCDANPNGLPVLRIPNVVAGRINVCGLKYILLGDGEASRLTLRREMTYCS